MADSLDDFFAKRDQKRTKGKKTIDGSGKPSNDEKPRKDKDKLNAFNSPIFQSIMNQNDGEWADFDEMKPNTGELKINNVSFREIEEEKLEQQQKQQQEVDESKRDGAWKVATPDEKKEEDDDDETKTDNLPDTESTTQSSEATTAVAANSTSSSSTTTERTNAYVPPHLRNAKPSSGIAPGSRRMKAAPLEINDQAEFPSLGMDGQANDGDFKYVKHGAKTVNSTTGESAINLGNKYKVLSDS